MTTRPTAIVFALMAAGVAEGSTSTARAQTPATANVSVDATAPGTLLEKIWGYHGYDEVNYSTSAPGQALLKTLGSIHSPPPHIRTHFLLNTGDGTASLKWGSTNAYTEDASGNPVYSFTLMDGIMDAITNAGTLPLVEIAFMPQALSTQPTPYQNSSVTALDGGCFYPPKDYAKWGALIRAWATQMNGRYKDVESSWLWELWNEPDIGYWHGTPAEYDKLYDYTEAAVHGVLPNAPLGGPAVASAGGTFLTQFLQHCATGTNAVSGGAGTRLDLITFHAKGGTAVTGGHVEMDLGNQLRLHRTGFNAVASVAQYKQTPIIVTEADPDGCAACPATTTPADAYRNSPAYGAYEVAMMKRSLELEAQVGVKLQGLLTWAFLFNSSPYFAGYRALQTNGIDLPVLGAFRLLGALSGTRLAVTSSGALTLNAILTNGVRAQADIDAMATQNGQSIQVLVWNYHDDIVTVADSPVHLSVKVPPSFGSRATISHLRVDDTHGDAYTVWVSQGSPANPTAAQVTALQQAMLPSAASPDTTIAVTGGTLTLDFTLPRFGISLLTITPVPAGDASTDASSSLDAAAARDSTADRSVADTGVSSDGGALRDGTGASGGDGTATGGVTGGTGIGTTASTSTGAGANTGATNGGVLGTTGVTSTTDGTTSDTGGVTGSSSGAGSGSGASMSGTSAGGATVATSSGGSVPDGGIASTGAASSIADEPPGCACRIGIPHHASSTTGEWASLVASALALAVSRRKRRRTPERTLPRLNRHAV